MKSRTKKIKGLVIPFKWDADGQVTEVLIASHDEVEYRLEETSAPRDLQTCLHQLVEVTGVVTREQDGRPVIRVLEYRRVDETFSSGDDTTRRSGLSGNQQT